MVHKQDFIPRRKQKFNVFSVYPSERLQYLKNVHFTIGVNSFSIVLNKKKD